MKVLAKEKGLMKLKTENINDLWCLCNVVSQGDLVRGQTYRKIKIGGKEDRSSSVVKKKVTLSIRVEKAEFSETTTTLRISGLVEIGPEDIPKSSHHTITVDENTIISITKERWSKYHLDKIDQATKYKGPKIVVVVMERDYAVFALLKGEKYDILSKLSGDVQKKAVDETSKGGFYPLVANTLAEYDTRYKLDAIIVASPAFWKDDFMKTLKDEDFKKKITLASCSSSSETAINEVLKRAEIQTLLKQDLVAKDIFMVDKLLEEISKDNLAVYGFNETKSAVEAGAAEKLLITDKLIHKYQSDKKYDVLDRLMKTVEDMKGELQIISSENDAGKKLDGLGGVAAILRYKLNY